MPNVVLGEGAGEAVLAAPECALPHDHSLQNDCWMLVLLLALIGKSENPL